MPLESVTYINHLNRNYPAGSDVRNQGDDHIRAIKAALLDTFPNIAGVMSKSHAELNATPHNAAGIIAMLGMAKDPTTSGGYFRFGNSIEFQWGEMSTIGTTNAVVFPRPYDFIPSFWVGSRCTNPAFGMSPTFQPSVPSANGCTVFRFGGSGAHTFTWYALGQRTPA